VTLIVKFTTVRPQHLEQGGQLLIDHDAMAGTSAG
jgi:hypothetical protein